MSTLVSIITATFNHERFIAECLESVLAQSYPDWEQIVVDDGSTDTTPDIIRRFGDPRIRFVPQPHRGPFRLGETYNEALRKARGSLIAILEGDDLWRPTFLAKMVLGFTDDKVVFSYARSTVLVDGKERSMGQPMFETWSGAERTNNPVGSSLKPLLCFEGVPTAATWVVRKTALESTGGFQQVDDLPTVDFPTLLHLATRGRFVAVDETLASWRKHAQQTTNRHSGALFIGCADYAESFYDLLPQGVKDSLPLKAEKLKKRLSQQRAFGWFRQGRHELLSRQWAVARSCFRAALPTGTFYVRGVSILGWIASWFRANIEGWARLAGKEWYRPSENETGP